MKWAFGLVSSVLYLHFRTCLELASILGKLSQLIKHKAVTQVLDEGAAPELAPRGCVWGSDLAAVLAAIPQPPTSLFDCLFSLKHMFPHSQGILSNSFPLWAPREWQFDGSLWITCLWICFKEGLAAHWEHPLAARGARDLHHFSTGLGVKIASHSWCHCHSKLSIVLHLQLFYPRSCDKGPTLMLGFAHFPLLQWDRQSQRWIKNWSHWQYLVLTGSPGGHSGFWMCRLWEHLAVRFRHQQ